MQPVSAECPVCGNTRQVILWATDADRAARHFVSPRDDPDRFAALVDHLKVLWNGATCEVVQCQDCLFASSLPFVGGDKQFYDLAYVMSGYPAWKWEFQVARDLIVEGGHTGPRVLEVGAGDGAFLKALRAGITDAANMVAFEFSDYGRRQIEQAGIRCYSEDVRTISPDRFGGKFDVICMFQVLEHLADIHALMNTFERLLKEDGTVIFAVPNDKRIEFNELNGALLDMPPNHVGRWTQAAFDIFAKMHGFSVARHSYEPATVGPMIKQFLKYRFLKRSQIPGSAQNRVLYGTSGLLRRLLRIGSTAIDAIGSAPSLAELFLRRKHLGNSQLVQLKRAEG